MTRFYISQLIEFLGKVAETSGSENPLIYVMRRRSSASPIRGFVPDFDTLLAVSKGLRLVSVKKRRIVLDSLSRKLIRKPFRDINELDGDHKSELALRLFVSGHELAHIWNPLVRKFRYDDCIGTFTLDIADITESEYPIVRSMLDLDMLTPNEVCYVLNSPYNERMKSLFADAQKTVSESELLAQLSANRELGKLAERVVLSSERRRLRLLGRELEAQSVKQISEEDVAAGFDIKSFDGDSPSVEFDRFIEVKGTTGVERTFYITDNERRAAERLGGKYWLYLVTEVEMPSRRKIHTYQCLERVLRDEQACEASPVLWQVTVSARP